MNKVLTATYAACYSDAMEGDELTLLTAPMCSTAELQSLYEGGIVDIESALPAALHSLGCTAVEIAGAVKRRRQTDESGSDTKLLEAQNMAKLGDGRELGACADGAASDDSGGAARGVLNPAHRNLSTTRPRPTSSQARPRPGARAAQATARPRPGARAARAAAKHRPSSE